MQIKKLLYGTSVKSDFDQELLIERVSLNSKKVKPGSLFCVVEGNNDRGANYLKEAVVNGAMAILAEKELPDCKVPLFLSSDIRKDTAIIARNFYEACDEKLEIYAVTGTNGKTTTVFALNTILQKAGFNVGYISTINKSWGGMVFPSSLTTPDSLELHGNFEKMLQSGCSACVMEASSHGIHQKRLYGIRFQTKIFTNVSQDHLDYHLSLNAYKKVKEDFMSTGEELSVVNVNDETGKNVLARKPNVASYGLGTEHSDLNGEILNENDSGMELGLTYEGIFKRVHLRNVFGSFMAENIMAAVLTSLKRGIEMDLVLEALETFTPPKGRMTRISDLAGIPVFIDYAHTPDALKKALVALRPYVKNNLKVLFGCGGNRDQSKRRLMGEIADHFADAIYLTSDNSRFEETADIIKEIRKGISKKNFVCIEDRSKAIGRMLFEAGEGDILLIAGKGHEEYQEINGKKVPFSDFEIVRYHIKKMKERKNV